MSVCNRPWVTYSENETDAWRCVTLVKSLKRSMTRHPITVIVSNALKDDLKCLLCQEFDTCFITGKTPPGKPFRTWAKEVALTTMKFRTGVFIDCRCVVVSNMDELFHTSGIEVLDDVENGGNCCALLSPNTRMNKEQQSKLLKYIAEIENASGNQSTKPAHGLPILKKCLSLDVTNDIPFPLSGEKTEIICYTNGHAADLMQKEITRTYSSLCILEANRLVEKLLGKLNTGRVNIEESLEPIYLKDSIAVVGMSCKYAGANSLQEFWEMLEKGLNGVQTIPENRWTQLHTTKCVGHHRQTKGAFLNSVDTFDAAFFNTSSTELTYMDPQARMALRLVWEALENANIDPLSLNNTLTGVYGGWWRNDYKDYLQDEGYLENDFLRGYMGACLGPFIARISHFLNLIGPAYSNETACSTSIVGVDQACDNLKSETCNLAIVVAANLLLHPYVLGKGAMDQVLSPDGKCKTFDANADGFGRAEGIGALILKRLPDAIRDGDHIWGIIRSSAVVQEGTSPSMGTPTVNVESKAMELALERSGLSPDDVSFVETHGTGTAVGDPVEVSAIARIFSTGQRTKPLILGSVKTNIGHTESVCGIAGIQKTLLALRNQLIPKHLHLKRLNPEIQLDSIPALIPLDSMTWTEMEYGTRIAVVNSFGFTGAQGSVVIQEPPNIPVEKLFNFQDQRSHHILTFSGKTKETHQALVDNYKTFLEETTHSIHDIEFTMHTGRAHFGNHRSYLIGSSREDFIFKLEHTVPTSVPTSRPKICFLFPGQGSQYPQMGKKLYEGNVIFRSHFDWCDSILQREHGISMVPAIIMEDSQLLSTTLYGQISIFVVEYALLKMLESWGLCPDAVLGHSLGEFAACVAGGVLSPYDALTMVTIRSKLINALEPSAMIVVARGEDTIYALMEEALNGTEMFLDIAAINSSDQTVLSGSRKAVQQFKTFCEKKGIKSRILDSSHAFHSRLMDPVLEEYKQLISNVTFQRPNCTYISSVSGEMTEDFDVSYWMKHIRDRVHFMDASRTAVDLGYTSFLETGPHPILSAMVMKNTDHKITCIPVMRKNQSDWEVILSAIGRLYCMGLTMKWSNFHRYSGAKKVSIPGYCFKEVPHWVNIKDGFSLRHPLLGKPIQNPSSVSIYKSELYLPVLPYLRDHKIFERTVFPCAGYVEMLLAATHDTTNCRNRKWVQPVGPLCLTDFSIVTPHILLEGQISEFQVTVEPDGMAVVHSRVGTTDGSFSWVKNAMAKITKNIEPLTQELYDLQHIKSRCSVSLPQTQERYDVAHIFGFNFRDSIQTLGDMWTTAEGTDEALATFNFSGDMDPYIVHPWITDSILQAEVIMFEVLPRYLKGLNKGLTVPVQIKSITWWGGTAKQGWVYVKNHGGTYEGYVYDNNGRLFMSMIGTEFVETTIGNIQALIESHANPYPQMAEIVWKDSKFSPGEARAPLGTLNIKSLQSILKTNLLDFTEEEKILHGLLQEVAIFYMVKLSEEKLVDEEFGTKFPWNVDAFEKMSQNFSKSNGCSKNGYSLNPKISESKDILIKLNYASFSRSIEQAFNSVPEDMNTAVEIFKEHCPTLDLLNNKLDLVCQLRSDALESIKETGKKVIIRILEISGRHDTKLAVEVYPNPECLEYTVGALSEEILKKHQNKFTELNVEAEFKLLDMDVDFLNQELLPIHYDVIVTEWALSFAQEKHRALANLRKLLRPGGILVLTEFSHISPDLLLSLTPPEHFSAILDHQENWSDALHEVGFQHIGTQNIYGDSQELVIAQLPLQHDFPMLEEPEDNLPTWIVFASKNELSERIMTSLASVGNTIQVIWKNGSVPEHIQKITSEAIENPNTTGVLYLWDFENTSNLRDTCKPFFYVCKEIAKTEKALDVVVLLSLEMEMGQNDSRPKPPATCMIETMLRVLGNENHNLNCKCVYVPPSCPTTTIMAEIYKWDDNESAVTYARNKREVRRLQKLPAVSNALPIPTTPQYKLVLPSTQVIKDLVFAPMEFSPVPAHHVEIQIKSYSLNFLDTLMVTKPTPLFNKYNYVGLDFAGVITRIGEGVEKLNVGDRVISLRVGGDPLPSHVVVDECQVLPLRDDMTFAEGSTFPIALFTVISALEDSANIREDDVLLIHTASGGVGLMAIQLAQRRYKCTVVVTAGTKRKREYLRNLGIKYVFNSRNINYAEDIRATLGGSRVTVVLNTLTGQGFKEATLSLCAKNARFIEISKINVWTKEEVAELRPDVYYEIVDVSAMTMDKCHKLHGIFRDFNFQLDPIPSTRFFNCDVRHALEYVQTVKHIGKVVITMPEVWQGNKPLYHLFSPESTYLITGGLGGIGMQVAKWMANSGAGTLLLLSRKQPGEAQKEAIEAMKNVGVKVVTRTCNVGNFLEIQEVFNFAKKNLPPIRGIMHLAGVLDDATYEHQTWEKYEHVFESKVYGAWNLHQLSLDLPFPMEYFVLFSSITATIGSPGQSNYAAANSYLDDLVAYRHSIGLPATSINWGQWGGVGMAANLDHPAFKPFSVSQGVAALEHVLRNNIPQVVAYEADLEFLKNNLPTAKTLLSGIESKEAGVLIIETLKEEFWSAYDSADDHESQLKVVTAVVKKILASSLGMSRPNDIEDKVELQNMGVDSLMLLELKNGLQAVVGTRIKIPTSAFRDLSTVTALSLRLMEMIPKNAEDRRYLKK